ncbi:MAG: DUF3021 family protein [Lachnospiraceae bacterium]|nr:DUF3021 family protein [Lachnospiraceae bacterium]
MEKKYTIFDFLGQVFFIFGITVACLSLFVIMFGKDAKDISTIFALGEKGLAITTLGQYFLMAFLLNVVRFVLFTDRIIKRWSVLARTISMFVVIIILIGTFAYMFGWFPVGDIKSWGMFFVCFFVCAVISVIVSTINEKKENEKLQEALERMKKGEL